MDRIKKGFFLGFALVLGILFLVQGVGEWWDSRRLAAEGKTTSGKVVDESTRRRSRGRATYYLTVAFRTESNQAVTRKVEVDYDTHRAGASSGAVQVFYLPAAPEVCQVGERVETKWFMAAMGALFLLGGLVGFIYQKQPANRKELAESVGEGLKTLCQTDVQYVPVDGRQFKGADLAFYDESQRRFEARGFVFLEDVEVVMPQPIKGFVRTFLRVLLSRDGLGIVSIFHLRPCWALRVLGVKETRVYGIDTLFSNNTFVSTDNAEACGVLEPTPACSDCHLPAASTIEMVVDTHEKRLTSQRASHPDVEPVIMHGVEDIHRTLALQQRIKGEHRQKIGLTKTELERMGGVTNNQVINHLHEDLKKDKAA